MISSTLCIFIQKLLIILIDYIEKSKQIKKSYSATVYILQKKLLNDCVIDC